MLPGGANILLPMFLEGFTPKTAAIPRICFALMFTVGIIVWIGRMIVKSHNEGEHFEMGRMRNIVINENERRPHWLVSLIPIVVVALLYNVANFSAWLSIACGTVVSAILFIPYIPIPEGHGRLATLVEKCNNASTMISLLLMLSYLPGLALTASPAYELILKLSSTMASAMPLAIGFGILAVVTFLMGNSSTILLCQLAMSIYIPAGMAVSTLSILLIVGQTVLDTLPNSPFIAAQAQLLDSPMPESYPPIFKTTVIWTFIMTVVAVVLAVIGII